MSLSSFFRSILSKPPARPRSALTLASAWSTARPPGFSLTSPFQHSAGIPKRSCPQFWPVLQSRPVPLSCSTPSRGGAFGGHLGRFLFSEPQDRACVLSCLWAPQGRMVPVEHASANKETWGGRRPTPHILPFFHRCTSYITFCNFSVKIYEKQSYPEFCRILQIFYRDLQNCAEKYRIR